jgi:hypothetical protein
MRSPFDSAPARFGRILRVRERDVEVQLDGGGKHVATVSGSIPLNGIQAGQRCAVSWYARKPIVMEVVGANRTMLTETEIAENSPPRIPDDVSGLALSYVYDGSRDRYNVHASWSPVYNVQVDHYIVTLRDMLQGQTETHTCTGTSLTLTEGMPGRSYQFQVYAVYDGANGAPCAPVGVTLPYPDGSLGPVTQLAYVWKGATLDVTWTHSGYPQDYMVSIYVQHGGALLRTYVVDATYFTWTLAAQREVGLRSSVYITVAARDRYGNESAVEGIQCLNPRPSALDAALFQIDFSGPDLVIQIPESPESDVGADAFVIEVD